MHLIYSLFLQHFCNLYSEFVKFIIFTENRREVSDKIAFHSFTKLQVQRKSINNINAFPGLLVSVTTQDERLYVTPTQL